MAAYEQLRQRHIAELQSLLPQHLDRLSWSAARLREECEGRLRDLIRVAQEGSPWHRERLDGIDPAAFREADLASIPPMTKADLMGNWDDIVTDRRLNLALVNSHLESLTTDRYLLDHYHAVASGGSSGLRGVFVYDWASWTLYALMWVRWGFRGSGGEAGLAGTPPVTAHISGGHATHLSSAILQTFRNPHLPAYGFPASLPTEQIVAGLNDLQPDELEGYPSALHVLAHEARSGRLRIAPRRVGTYAEPLLPEIRATLEQTWRVPVSNRWGCSEGATAVGVGCRGMHLSDDLAIFELVDAEGEPVPAGVRSAKIYLTNLCNHALPLIRYEITDEMTLLDEPCSCGSAHRRIDDIQGRMDDTFTYGAGIRVHPIVFRSVLGRERNILEYQVRQTERGAALAIRCAYDVDIPSLRREIERELGVLGLPEPEVTIAEVEQFQRLPTGKLKRFVPLD
jgi:phenylacetate-coenzyme A ligase PaaK-like adenylate-forming protein